MCGITGVISKEPLESVLIEKAAHLQNHRGPDHYQLTHGPNYCFCHNRLSLIDLSARSHQPLENDQGILVFNGEIYNFKELSLQYLDTMCPYSDTHVLFSLLQHNDTSILSRLNGMFAFAYYNKISHKLLLARDRFGIKPLYYCMNNKGFFFASELKTMLSLLDSLCNYNRKSDINTDYIYDIIVYGHAEFGLQPFKSIKELNAGTYLYTDDFGSSSHQHTYFSISDTISETPSMNHERIVLEDHLSILDTHLKNSIKLHLISDAPLGVLCSGGIDSSLITAIAATMNSNLKIYHATVHDSSGELPYAQMVAKRYGLSLSTIKMTPELYCNSLVDCIYHLDSPMYHPSDISLFAIAKKAHHDGIKALLCGEGADELFGGYGWHSVFKRSVQHYTLLKNFSHCIDLFYRFFRIFRYADQFSPEEFFTYTGNYLSYATHNIPVFAKRNAFLRNRSSWQVLNTLKTAYNSFDSFPELAAFITSNCFGHLSTLLQRNDRMCMQANIESRVPFIENHCIEYALTLDSTYKIKGRQGKYLLKKYAEQYLPHKVIYRKKAGFPVPWNKYLGMINSNIFKNGFLSTYFDCSNDDLYFWTKHDKNLFFTALSLEIWGRIFIEQNSHETVKDLIR